jgi:rhodanese-related sulfurtransferase
MKQNPNFMAALEQQVEKEALVMFLCRSAHRSHAAATVATQAGYSGCYNILEGFEGDRSNGNRRNVLNGWRRKGLPWEQS